MASPFSGRAGRLAGMWAAGQANAFAEKGQGLIDAGKAEGLGYLGKGRTDALSALGRGYDAARPQYQGAIDRFAPYVQDGRAADGVYQGSLGLGGEAARDAAVAAFREAPGYRYSVDQATDAVARKQSALGALGSGNTMQAISDRAQGMADQGYRGWQDQIKGIGDRGFSAAGAQSGIQTQLGNLEAQYGRDQSGLYTGFAGQEAGLVNNATNQSLANLGQQAQTVIGAGSGALMAGQTAAQNRLNFGMQMGSLVAPILGQVMGMGGFGGMGGGGSGGMPGNMGPLRFLAGT